MKKFSALHEPDRRGLRLANGCNVGPCLIRRVPPRQAPKLILGDPFHKGGPTLSLEFRFSDLQAAGLNVWGLGLESTYLTQ